ncbi:helix-turn-helix domain-containing protein [Streptomyces sp. ML-6]|uniref:helix-turn-helix transcriptional regulator n=1 Tax=Streptomyces sp. ML-6 TaxID=2982693 RepID=UPI0024C0CAE9|nr:helix-turn-helix domain-containing protein [Streptomyces sp. ML-6]MDK0521919.1 helix-turn-helix domain-containing protein [Streptomyces sp. ML-6]
MERERAIGLDRQTEFVYRMLLRRRRWRMSELCGVLDVSEESLGRIIEGLREEGLVAASADDDQAIRAVEPSLALPALATRRFQDAQGSGLPGAVAVERLIALHERAADRIAEPVETGSVDEASALVERLATTVRHEVVMLVPEHCPGSFEFSRHVADAVLRRDAALRQVWGASFLHLPAVVEHARWLGGQGAAPCTLPHVPTRAVVIDGAVGVLFDESGGARVLRGGTALDSLKKLARRLWDSSMEVRQALSSVPAQPTRPRREQILRLLADGLTDDAIARRIGVSVRTVRNDVASTMLGLDARSRFQAGVRAAQMGLL